MVINNDITTLLLALAGTLREVKNLHQTRGKSYIITAFTPFLFASLNSQYRFDAGMITVLFAHNLNNLYIHYPIVQPWQP